MECLFDRRHGFSFTDWKDVINAMLNEGTYGMDEEQIKLMKLGFATAVAVRLTPNHRTKNTKLSKRQFLHNGNKQP